MQTRRKGSVIAPETSAAPTAALVPPPWMRWIRESHRWMAAVGTVYMCLTLWGSLRFLTTSSKSLSNDFFWTEFTATGAGIYLAQAYNWMLRGPQASNATIRLDHVRFLTDNMQTISGMIAFAPTSARLVQYYRLRGIEQAIRGIRQTSPNRTPHLFTQYCWVDFQRRWSLAHTPARASRCEAKYTQNGAVYVETFLRNTDWNAFVTSSYGQWFMIGIGDPIHNLSDDGKAFIDQLAMRQMLSVQEEAAYWRQVGIQYYELQYQNRNQIGIVDKIEIVNALDMTSTWTIKQLEPANRYASQTTYKLSWGFQNDLWAVAGNNTKMAGRSLVRETPTFYGNGPIVHTIEHIEIEDGVLPYPFTAQDSMLRQVLGPFGSIDAFWTMYPPELFALIEQVIDHVNAAITSNTESAAQSFLNIPTDAYLPLNPMQWSVQNYSFMGGNPLCSRTPQVSYVLRQFVFEDTCGNTLLEENTVISRVGVVVAYLASIAPEINQSDEALGRICSTAMLQQSDCRSFLSNATAFVTRFLAFDDRKAIFQQAHAVQMEISRLNVSLMQYATRHNETTMLLEPLIPSNDNGWHAFFGWLYLYDWVRGNREVVTMEGDEGTIRLISGFSRDAILPPNKAEIEHSMSLYFQRGVQYVTIVFLFIASLVLWYTIANVGQISGWNLLDFNRVCGTVWVGRPLLLLRGLVAICMLSTGRLLLAPVTPQLIQMQERPETWFNTILNAGEAVWLVYVANDVLMILSQRLTHRYARLCSFSVWLTVAILQLMAPIQHTATLEPQCEFTAPDIQVTCLSGTIWIGSRDRFVVILAIVTTSLVVCYVVAWCCCAPRVLRPGCQLLLPGIAQQIFSSRHWMLEGEWYVDPASAAIAGLITIRLGRITRVLDVKSWSLLHLRHGKLVDPTALETSSPDPKPKLPDHLQYAIRLSAMWKHE